MKKLQSSANSDISIHSTLDVDCFTQFYLQHLNLLYARCWADAQFHLVENADEGDYVLKPHSDVELQALESLLGDAMVEFIPQCLGEEVVEGNPHLKWKDITSGMVEPQILMMTLGLRTFLEEEVSDAERQADLLNGVCKAFHNVVPFSTEDQEKGITKCQYHTTFDAATTTCSLGFRFCGVFSRAQPSQLRLPSCRIDQVRAVLHDFLALTSDTQRLGLLSWLRRLRHAASHSEWLGQHELVASSLMLVVDRQSENKCGVWLADLHNSRPSPTPLLHTVAWAPGNHEDGFLFGLDHVIQTMQDELQASIPLVPSDWVFRAEGANNVIAGYRGDDPGLKGKVLRLGKASTSKASQHTACGHPALSAHHFLTDMVGPHLGEAVGSVRVVYMTPEFLGEVAEMMEAQRGNAGAQEGYRIDVASPYALLMEDAVHLEEVPNPDSLMIKWKVGCGILPPPSPFMHWLKATVSRSALLQYYKSAQGTSAMSDYCPVDLLSNDFERILSALLCLFECPAQAEMQLFRGGKLLVTAKDKKQSKSLVDHFAVYLNASKSYDSIYFISDLLANILLKPQPGESATALQRLKWLQSRGLDIEVLFPKVQDFLRGNLHLLSPKPADVLALPGTVVDHHVPYGPIFCNAVNKQRRRSQAVPHGLSRLYEHVNELWALRKAEVADVTARCASLNPRSEIVQFLTSKAAKECSIAVTIYPAKSSGTENTVEAVDGTRWHWRVSFLDLDPQDAAKMEEWFTEDKDLVTNYKNVALEESMPPEYESRLAADSIQIGGHSGAILVESHLLLKRCEGSAELDFYTASAHHPVLKEFMPRFYGCEQRGGHQYIVIENLLHDFANPMMLDLKMGTRTYGDDADPAKMAKQRAKASCSTSSKLGVMVVGCQLPHNEDGREKLRLGRKFNHDILTEESVVTVLSQFLRTKRLKEAAQQFVNKLYDFFRTQREFAFYGSSLLFAYDAELGDNAELRVRMIDFAHVHPPPNEGLDESYLTGLVFLLKALEFK
eukprot:GGOE01007153.1.p1 GENE.GGOE01007153.1~~GGOE01007153.1.p1  ORF type:complete len:1008 (-),score=263.25 GGOE01007153.1:270-3293(-)